MAASSRMARLSSWKATTDFASRRSRPKAKNSPACPSHNTAQLFRALRRNAVYRLPVKEWKRPTSWKQLVPRCSHGDCKTGTSWTGVLHRASGFWFNERDWFCSPRCLEAALDDRLHEYFFAAHRPEPIRTTMPMGLMMLSRGMITELQLRAAIEQQRTTG